MVESSVCVRESGRVGLGGGGVRMSLVSVAVLGSPVSASHLTVKVLRLLLAFRGVLETELRLSGLCAGTCMMKPSPPLCTCFNLPHATWMQHISPSVFPGRAIFQSRAASAFLPPFHPRPCQGWCAHAHRHTQTHTQYLSRL